ncbi:MAG: hypothetical protein F4X57_12710 [Chloroflexi bacterium]|nr:hypothetical protein [Chloroflexota bacterium]
MDEIGSCRRRRTGAELFFEVFSQGYERGSIIPTNDARVEMIGSGRLTGALLDLLTHHAHVIEMNGDGYRLKRNSRADSG